MRGPFFFLAILAISLQLNSAAIRKTPEKAWGIGNGLESEEIADKVSKLGTGWVRSSFVWAVMEPERGQFDWRSTDVQVRRARKRALKICALLGGTPGWANGSHSQNKPPDDTADWIHFVSAVVSRYKNTGIVEAYAVWNEPNISRFWDASAHEFSTKILIPGARTIKEADPYSLVVAPELSHHWMSDSQWALAGLIQRAAEYINVVGIHYYPDAPLSFDRYLDEKIKSARMEKPVWITEIGEVGCSGKKGSLEEQSQFYADFLKTISERSDWITNVFPYRIWDPKDECNKNGNGFGLTFGSPPVERPAFQLYQGLIQKQTSY